jgi:hypothetical protein
MFSLHATKKLLDRVKQPIEPTVSEPTTVLGNWYGTVLFWKPQVALLVNERTFYPVMMPLAPASTLLDRMPDAVRETWEAAEVAADFIDAETAAMAEGRYAKTASRSVLGVMNEFRYLATFDHERQGQVHLPSMGLWLAQTPTSPLRDSHGAPDLELAATVAAWSGRGSA